MHFPTKPLLRSGRPHRALRGILLTTTAIAAALFGSAASAAAAETYFTGIANTAGGLSTEAYGVSADGGNVVGDVATPSGYSPFIYAAGSLQVVDLSGDDGEFYAVSGDGSTAVGEDDTLGKVLIYDASGVLLLDTGSGTAAAYAVSFDGTVVVGIYNSGSSAFRYSSGVLTDLGGVHAYASGVSDNGSVVVGTSTFAGLHHATIFSNGQVQDLGTLGGPQSSATAVSGDGTIVVGQSRIDATYTHAFRWAAGTMSDLGVLPATDESEAKAISRDGSTVVGSAKDTASSMSSAFRWRADKGMQSIAGLLTASGVDITGWTLKEATGVSADGTVIVGIGQNPSTNREAWIVRCTNECGMLTVADTATSFSGLGALGATGSTYIAGQFEADGDMAQAGKNSGSPTTGFASGAFDSDPTTSASVGATYALGNDLVVGATVGVAGIQTLTPFNGSAVFGGPSATVFVASKPDTGPNWLVGGSLVGLGGTVTRGYLNGNTPVTSSGSTTGVGSGFTAEAGWTFKDLVANTLVTPFVSLTVSSMSYAAYSETGGPFPASFSAFSTTSAVARLGVDGRYEFQKHSYLSASLSYGHDFGSGGTIAGTIPGVLTLSVPGAAPATDFIEAGLGVDMPLKDNIRLDAHLGAFIPFTGSPSLQARAGVSMAF